MKTQTNWLNLALVSGLAVVAPANADVTINTFDDFTSDALYASWASASIISGPTSYVITATGYGSNWKYNPVDGSGTTTVELTVTLSGPSAASGFLGPIVTLEDADGTSYNFAWFGQLLGSHVLTKPLNSPTWIGAAGTVAGLNPATITHLHMQLDPGTYGTSGPYTIEWENLSLTGSAPPVITTQSYNPETREFTLTWTSAPGKNYTIMQTGNLSNAFAPLVTDIPSAGGSTTTTVTMPAGNAGFLRVLQQP